MFTGYHRGTQWGRPQRSGPFEPQMYARRLQEQQRRQRLLRQRQLREHKLRQQKQRRLRQQQEAAVLKADEALLRRLYDSILYLHDDGEEHDAAPAVQSLAQSLARSPRALLPTRLSALLSMGLLQLLQAIEGGRRASRGAEYFGRLLRAAFPAGVPSAVLAEGQRRFDAMLQSAAEEQLPPPPPPPPPQASQESPLEQAPPPLPQPQTAAEQAEATQDGTCSSEDSDDSGDDSVSASDDDGVAGASAADKESASEPEAAASDASANAGSEEQHAMPAPQRGGRPLCKQWSKQSESAMDTLRSLQLQLRGMEQRVGAIRTHSQLIVRVTMSAEVTTAPTASEQPPADVRPRADTAEEPAKEQLAKLKVELSVLNGRLEKLQARGLDSVMVGPLVSAQDDARALRKSLNSRVQSLHQQIRPLYSQMTALLAQL